MNKFLTIIIPSYNEADRLGGTLDQYLRFFKQEDIDFLVVLNGCTDGTLNIAQKYQKEHPDRVSYLDIKEAIGKGGAIREGFKVAQAKYISFLDADASTSPEEFQKLIDNLDQADGVIASRWKKGSKIIGANFIREVVSIGFIVFVKILFWMSYVDTQCGAKIFKSEVIKKILPRMRINNMTVDVEILYLIKQEGYKIIEIPTIWEDNSDSSAALGSPFKLFKASFGMFSTLLKIRFGK
ncbi:MAG: glycosyltransferase [bacterium]|nr:glycosyltransferase [bacterium]